MQITHIISRFSMQIVSSNILAINAETHKFAEKVINKASLNY